MDQDDGRFPNRDVQDDQEEADEWCELFLPGTRRRLVAVHRGWPVHVL